MKRDMKGLNTDDAEVAKAGFLAAVNADYRSCVSDIMTGIVVLLVIGYISDIN